MEIDKLGESFKGPDRIVVKPPVDDVASSAQEIKDNQVQDSSGDKSLKSEQPDFKVETEYDGNSRGLLNFQSSPYSDTKDPGIASDHMSENSKLNDATVCSSLSSDHKSQDVGRSLEAVNDSHADNADDLSSNPCQLKPEDSLENSMDVQRIPSEPKNGSEFSEEHSKPGGTMLNFPAMPSQRKFITCAGKSSTSSTVVIPKSSTSESYKSADALNPNPVARQQVMPDCTVSARKDRASLDVRDEARDEMSRRTVKDHSKSCTNSAPKPLHSSRISHDSVSKQITSEPKESVLYSSSKTSSVPHTAVTSGSSEPTGSLPNQKAVHLHNKSSASTMLQRGEKLNQTSFQASSKINQNLAPSMCPTAPSSSPATLSDEEVSLEISIFGYKSFGKLGDLIYLFNCMDFTACFTFASRTQQLASSTSRTTCSSCRWLTSAGFSKCNKHANKAHIEFRRKGSWFSKMLPCHIIYEYFYLNEVIIPF